MGMELGAGAWQWSQSWLLVGVYSAMSGSEGLSRTSVVVDTYGLCEAETR